MVQAIILEDLIHTPNMKPVGKLLQNGSWKRIMPDIKQTAPPHPTPTPRPCSLSRMIVGKLFSLKLKKKC